MIFAVDSITVHIYEYIRLLTIDCITSNIMWVTWVTHLFKQSYTVGHKNKENLTQKKKKKPTH